MQHGSKNFDVTAPRSRFYQGGFGRIFADLDPWAPEGVPDHQLEEHFLKFASEQMVEFPGKTPGEIISGDSTADAGNPNAPLNSAMPSGYVYFGQFIDHDLTLDVTPLSDAELDPNRLHNFRTPRLDLDCLYGQGPDAQPHLYQHNSTTGAFTGKLLVTPITGPDLGTLDGKLFDLQRNGEGKALIGDPRNDENAIVAQIHLAFTLAHNKLVDIAISKTPSISKAEAFNQARKTLRWLYQWIVWNDFLMRIADKSVHNAALARKKQPDGRHIWKPGYDDVYSWKNQPFMPLEFSVAAYRFGHSMVRNAYQTNLRKPPAGVGTFFPIFNKDHSGDLASGKPLELRRVLQWDWFLQMTSSVQNFPQRARKIDTKLSNALMFLSEDPDLPADPTKVLNVLAARNLTRGVRMKLPSGPDVARHLGVDVVPLDEKKEPATLWYYILKEAEKTGGNHLGAVGSIIVCATFAGILKGDPLSWFNQQPLWEPDKDPLLKGQGFNEDDGNNGNPEWGLPAIVRMSGLPVAGGDFRAAQPAPPQPVTV